MCFFNLSEEAYLGQHELSPLWKLWFAGKVPFKNSLNSHRESICKMLQLLTYRFIGESHELPQLSWIVLIGTKWAFLQRENCNYRLYSFPTLTQFSYWINLLQAAASNINSFLQRDTCLYSTQLNRNIWSNSMLTPPWKLWFAGTILSKANSILTVNNVLHAPASNTVAFLSRYTCVSSTQLNRPIWNNISFPPPWKRWFAGSIPFQN
jgi:hypothetical protein